VRINITTNRRRTVKRPDTPAKEALVELAHSAGFDLCRVTAASTPPHKDALLRWIAEGSHASMAWMERSAERRADPQLVLPGCKSIVLLATNYWQGDAPPPVTNAKVARYAWGLDYHDIIRERLNRLDTFLMEYGGIQRVYVDTGHVMERDFAAAAGLGWQGKSTMLINEKLGTWFFLSSILTTLDLEPDPPAKHRCGSCTKCLDACPTGAITRPFHVDARRCISYLTIENKEAIPEELRAAVGDRIFGCDDCLEACPWNRFAVESREVHWQTRPELKDIPLRRLLQIDQPEFSRLFKGSPVKRIKLRGLRRNVCVALGNVGRPEDLPALRAAASGEDLLVAEHAEWAIRAITARITQPGSA
jgi:epoxyqueuosine reductase